MNSLVSSKSVDYQKCAELIGSRYDMILIASLRAKELKKVTVKGKPYNGHVITALKEIENGLIGREYLNKLK